MGRNKRPAEKARKKLAFSSAKVALRSVKQSEPTLIVHAGGAFCCLAGEREKKVNSMSDYCG